MKYLLLIYGADGAGPARGTPEGDAEMAQWFSYVDELSQTGKMLGGDPLEGIEAATTVRVRDGERLMTDGPFAETKEMLGGYFVIDADSLDEALDWAGRMPNISYGSVEVRPIADMAPETMG